jgi:sugar lactone lactonase YvrE
VETVNFAYRDLKDRIWITVSTRVTPFVAAVETPTPDGRLYRMENGRLRLMAEGFHFTNEVRVDQAGKHIYVAETALGRVSRFALDGNGELGGRETFGPATLFQGALIDGIVFDADGNLWVTEVSRNGIYVITPNGEHRCIFRDPPGKTLQFPASLTFAGPDLKTVYIGSLLMSRLGMFRSPVPGQPMAHW